MCCPTFYEEAASIYLEPALLKKSGVYKSGIVSSNICTYSSVQLETYDD